VRVLSIGLHDMNDMNGCNNDMGMRDNYTMYDCTYQRHVNVLPGKRLALAGRKGIRRHVELGGAGVGELFAVVAADNSFFVHDDGRVVGGASGGEGGRRGGVL
jgi:hypothetical protein